jgi:hypothetical protein
MTVPPDSDPNIAAGQALLPRRSTTSLWAAFIRWILCGVGLALLPVGMNWVSLNSRGTEVSPSVILGNGELLLVSAAIGATATSELIVHKTERFELVRSLLVGFNFILVLAASVWFGDLSAASRSNEEIDYGFVSTGSVIVFVSELIVSGGSFLITRAEER